MKKLYYAEGNIEVHAYYYVKEGEDARQVGTRALHLEAAGFDIDLNEVAEMESPDDLFHEADEFQDYELHFKGPDDPRDGGEWLEEMEKTPERRAEEAAMKVFLRRQLRLPGVE